MPNIDITNLGALNPQHVRLLRAIEQAMKNHEYAPLQVINQIAEINGIHGVLADLCRYDLVEHVGGSSDGYKLTYEGFDYLAFKILEKKGVIVCPEQKIGVGKEAEVWICSTAEPDVFVVVKLHKLGLTSFKTVRTARNYAKQQLPFYKLSQKAAAREAGFGTALQERGFPVPHFYGIALHAVCMELIPGVEMSRLRGIDAEEAAFLAWELYRLMKRMLDVGVVHGDCNEYNCIVETSESVYLKTEEADALDGNGSGNIGALEANLEENIQTATAEVSELPREKQVFERITIIDFPQLIEFNDPEAELQFDRDVNSIEGFVNRRFDAGIRLPRFAETVGELRISTEITATENFARKIIKEMEETEEELFETEEADETEKAGRNKYEPIIKYKEVDIKRAARREADRVDRERVVRRRMNKGLEKAERDRFGGKDDY